MMYTTSANVGQTNAVDFSNPAVECERERLEQRSLDAFRKWARMNPIERVFFFDLETAATDLLAFEDRHQAQREAA